MKLFTRKNALLLTAVIILLAAACAFALSREQKPLFVSEPSLAPDDERDFMSVSVEATGDLRTVKGSMCLTATNRTGEDLSEIVLRAYPNAIQQGSVTLYGATVNGESVPVGHGQRRSLRLADSNAVAGGRNAGNQLAGSADRAARGKRHRQNG